MTSRGEVETQRLKKNLEEQLDRLVQQLADLEECREDLDPSEYEETRGETVDQLRDFNKSLSKMISGDMTLVDQLGSMQLATQAAISAAFRTPAVIRMFARREPGQLRQRLSEVERDMRLGKRASDQEKVEILSALRQLGEQLSPSEMQFLEQHSLVKTHFVQVNEEANTSEKVLDMAGSQVRAVRQT